MSCPPEVLALIERFNEQREDYQNPAYLETQLRIEFIDPLLKILGWDIENKQGFAEAYKEVIHEYSLKTKDATKAPDYCFRIGGTRKYFLEAKKPSENIKEDKKHAYQLRRYAWSADLPLSILTDFQEWAVYDTLIKPEEKDKASTARVMFFTCDELPEKWDEFAAIFSKEAIQKGSFDKFAQSNKKKRGTGRVDAEFLAEIERWRDILAHNIALRNEGLSQRDLNFSVQRIIDRIIFLRIAEDRGIEDYGRLQALNGDNIYPRLMQLFRAADDRYNSGIFHFEKEKGRSENPDEVTPDLAVDDKVLRDILESLYYPASPYEFSVLPADILGQVYEQFLGKVITLTPGHRAKVDEKPEVKKAGGVYYTPTYIVDYIVQQTVGKLLDGKTPKQAAKLTILDPACGSGSFLIGAYQFLLDWHLQWYVNDGPEKHRKDIYLGGKASGGRQPPDTKLAATNAGDWRLTSAERKRILLNNIYGVDIDEQAVEVTKLSLLLKVLEGENRESLDRQLRLVEKHRALPDLGNNIKCGNSLIGHDFYAGKQLDMFDEEEKLRINTFEWKDEFPAIMKAGGFDAVIGNPPYVRIQTMMETTPDSVEFLTRSFKSTRQGNYDLYVVFVEKGLALLNSNGHMGFILPHKFFNSQYGQPLREHISRGKHIEEIVHFGAEQVFGGATTYTCLLFLAKSGQSKFTYRSVTELGEWRIDKKEMHGSLPISALDQPEWNFVVGPAAKLVKKMSSAEKKLGDIADIFVGLQTSADDVLILDIISVDKKHITVQSKATETNWKLEPDLLHAIVSGTDVSGYQRLAKRQVVLFPYRVDEERATLIPFSEIQANWPKTAAYLEANQERLRKRERGKFNDSSWHRFGRNQNLGIQNRVKLCIPRLVERLHAGYDHDGSLFLDNVDVGGVTLKPAVADYSLPFLQGLLNSRLLAWFFPFVSAPFRGGWRSANRQFLSKLPIRKPNDKLRKKIVALVEQISSLHQQLPSAKSDLAKAALERQITATDRQIDELVYELYELTPEEVKIVEEATA
ncbi:MAG: N-6 DNA methylase [Pirellulaceae bacterium]|nr:N-6 DNA methylase [Pirellulaceae bacterium]